MYGSEVQVSLFGCSNEINTAVCRRRKQKFLVMIIAVINEFIECRVLVANTCMIANGLFRRSRRSGNQLIDGSGTRFLLDVRPRTNTLHRINHDV
jgi:hypothetical protein